MDLSSPRSRHHFNIHQPDNPTVPIKQVASLYFFPWSRGSDLLTYCSTPFSPSCADTTPLNARHRLRTSERASPTSLTESMVATSIPTTTFTCCFLTALSEIPSRQSPHEPLPLLNRTTSVNGRRIHSASNIEHFLILSRTASVLKLQASLKTRIFMIHGVVHEVLQLGPSCVLLANMSLTPFCVRGTRHNPPVPFRVLSLALKRDTTLPSPSTFGMRHCAATNFRASSWLAT
jgi:hypothetical protein